MRKSSKYYIKKRQLQEKADGLFKDVKVKKAELTITRTSFLKEVIDSIDDERRNYFRIQMDKYQQMLVNCINEQEAERKSIFNKVLYFDELNLQSKEQVLRKLVLVCEKLSKQGDCSAELIYGELKEELYNYTHKLDDIFFLNTGEDSFGYHLLKTFKLVSELSHLRKEIKYLLCKRFILLKRDLRRTYRNIVRFIFKNMDDQSGEADVCSFKNRDKHSIHPIKFFHGSQVCSKRA